MRELKFTLYEVLGYLFPGSVGFAGLLIVMWGLRWPHLHIDAINQASRRELAVITVFVYLLGHLLQAIANWVDRVLDKFLSDGWKRTIWGKLLLAIVRAHEVLFVEKKMEREKQGTLPSEINDRVRETLSGYYKLDLSEVRKLKENLITELCDAAVVANGAPEEREIYVYREGFYRGVWLGLCFVALALLIPFIRQLVLSDICAETRFHTFKPASWTFAVVALATYLGSCFAYFRYWRFRNYRIDSCFLFFVNLGKGKSKG